MRKVRRVNKRVRHVKTLGEGRSKEKQAPGKLARARETSAPNLSVYGLVRKTDYTCIRAYVAAALRAR